MIMVGPSGKGLWPVDVHLTTTYFEICRDSGCLSFEFRKDIVFLLNQKY